MHEQCPVCGDPTQLETVGIPSEYIGLEAPIPPEYYEREECRACGWNSDKDEEQEIPY